MKNTLRFVLSIVNNSISKTSIFLFFILFIVWNATLAKTILRVSAGWEHTVALKSDGTVWTWGCNWAGQLGIGIPFSIENKPVQVKYLNKIVTLASGWMHSIAAKSDGTLYAWGYNGPGELGDGTFTNRSSPVSVKLPLLETDAAGNISEVAQDDIILDTITPTTITAKPRSESLYITTDTRVSLRGTASSDSVSGIKSVSRWNDKGGKGGASGDVIWNIAHVGLSEGVNVITIAARDGAGSEGADTTEITNERDILAPATTRPPHTSPESFGTDIKRVSDTDKNISNGTVKINNNADYTNSCSVTLNLSASDDAGIAGYFISLDSTKPLLTNSGWKSVPSTTSYSEDIPFTLSYGDGAKTVYVWYKDTSGNISEVASDSIYLDTTAPVVNIKTPSSGKEYLSTSSTISLGGSAEDNEIGVKSVTWSDDMGRSGMAYGTTSWTISDIGLPLGSITITVTAIDNAGNIGSAKIIIAYGIAPTVMTVSASNITSDSVTLSGKVNAYGLYTTAWFEYGTESGQYDNTTPPQNLDGTTDSVISAGIMSLLQGKTYYYRVTARNNAGTAYGDEMSFDTLDTTAPVGSITIKGGDTYTNSTTVTINLAASDNVGVTGYYISTSKDASLAIAERWKSVPSATNYNANISYALSSGDGTKTVYVWFRDNSWNISEAVSDDIVLDTTAPSVTITKPCLETTYATTSSPVSLGGTATDGMSGIRGVTWCNSKGENGVVSGKKNWRISQIGLREGVNVITIAARDGAGNEGTDAIEITLNKDNIAPVGFVSISNDSKLTDTSSLIINLSAHDNVGVTGYYISHDPITPSINKSGWKFINPVKDYDEHISFGSSSKTKTVYVWYRDASGNISKVASGDIVVDTGLSSKAIKNTSFLPIDSTVNKKTEDTGTSEFEKERVENKARKVPEVAHLKDTDPPDGSVTINNDEKFTDSRNVTVNLSATDNVGIVGYYISMYLATPSSFNTGWKYITSTPRLKEDVSYIVSGNSGAKIICVWYKDLSGNVSKAASDDIILNITPGSIILDTKTTKK